MKPFPPGHPRFDEGNTAVYEQGWREGYALGKKDSRMGMHSALWEYGRVHSMYRDQGFNDGYCEGYRDGRKRR